MKLQLNLDIEQREKGKENKPIKTFHFVRVTFNKMVNG